MPLQLSPSEEIVARVPLSDAAAEVVMKGRQTLQAILDHKDPRIFVVVGPCSIHAPDAHEKARLLSATVAEWEHEEVAASHPAGAKA